MDTTEVEVTIEQVMLFRANASNYLENHPAQTKFSFCLHKMISRTNEHEKKYRSDVDDKRVELATEDDKKNLMLDEKDRVKLTKEATKTLNQFVKERMDKKVKIEPYVVKVVPTTLTPSQVEVFQPFVIDKNYQYPEPEEIEDKKE